MYHHTIKRLSDIIITSLLCIFLLPIFLLTWLSLKLTEGKTLFFSQERVGFNSQLFTLWKFRTMSKNSPKKGAGYLTIKNDSRVTPIGHFLRHYKLDELPQLILVLKGDLSLVGPRPVVPDLFKSYPKNIRHKIYRVKPGVTGIGSLAFRNENVIISNCGMDPNLFYNMHIAPHKAALELWYQKNISLTTDLKILFLTAWVLFFPNSNLVNKVFTNLPKWSHDRSKEEIKIYSLKTNSS